MENKKTFGLFLTEQRLGAGLTQKELADKLCIGESAVSKWERDVAKPDIEMVADLAKVFHISTDELITASVDLTRAREKKEARAFRGIRSVYNLTLFISFGIALLVCFIVNLAVEKRLSWFFVVVCGLSVAGSLLIVPQFIKNRRLLWVPLIFLGALFILLTVINIYDGGRAWFFVAVFALILLYSVIFTPMILPVRAHRTVISLCIDAAALLLMLAVINIYEGGSAWFFTTALPIVAVCLVPVFITALVIIYVEIYAFYKTSILILLWTAFTNAIGPISDLFSSEPSYNGRFWQANIFVWNGEAAIQNNIYLFMTIAAALTAAAFAVAGFLLHRRKR
jgi:transcriptional regulator with XRE-family HTH domain